MLPPQNSKMVDFVDGPTRSRWMAGIKGRNTQPELTIRRCLHAAGLRYRLHVARLPGRPDVVLPRHHVCIFVNGCFWHHHIGCDYAPLPTTRPHFWAEKFRCNAVRDAAARCNLMALGWRVIDIWECGLRDVIEPDLAWLPTEVRCGSTPYLEWPIRPVKRDGKRFTRQPR